MTTIYTLRSESVTPDQDPLLEYRVNILESSHKDLAESHRNLADSVKQIVAEIRAGKWAFAIVFGFLQPIVVGIAIYVLSRGVLKHG